MATVEKPLIVIVGPTASGKSSVAMKIALKYSGEIICSDSRTLYKGMDIGTAKPSAEEQAMVPHWGLDLVEPGDSYSAADFKAYALQKIAEIRARGNLPIMVGGSGMYVDAVVLDYQFGPAADPARREKLSNMTIEQLHAYCFENNIVLPENDQNKRYVIRAIERASISNTEVKLRTTPIGNSLVVGITTQKEELRRRIEQRTDQFFETGVVDEVKRLAEQYGWDNEAMTGNIYKLVRQYIDGEYDFDELKRRNSIADWQLAKRQLTWFRRRDYITWLPLEQVEQFVGKHLT